MSQDAGMAGDGGLAAVQALLDASRDLMLLLTPDGRVVSCNRMAAQLLAKTRDELLDSNVFDLLTPATAARQQGCLARAAATGRPEECEEVLDGRSYHVIYDPVLDQENRVQAVAVHASDITERRQSEALLREREEVMRYIVKHDPNAVAVYDLNLHYMAVSNRYLQDYKVEEREILGKHHYEVFPEMPQKWKDVHCRCLAGAIERNDDDQFERPDGSITYNRWECRPWYRAGGQIGGIITYTEVTTERKQAEERLRRSERELRKAQQVAHVGNWFWHIQTNRLEWSDEMYRIFGLDKETFSGDLAEVIARAIHPDDRAKVEQANLLVINSQVPVPLDYRVIWPDRTVRVVWGEAGELTLDETGRPAVLTGVVQDITERRRLEEQYRQAQKMEAVGRLAAGVAHDFNNQLTVIRGYCELLMAGLTPSDPSWPSLVEIRRAADRAKSTTSHLLSFSRKQALRPERVDLARLLTEMRDPVAKLIGEDISLRVVADPDLSPILVDRATLQQAVMNLIVNASDAMADKGELTLRAGNVQLAAAETDRFPGAAPGPYVLLEVADTGTGMDQETLDHLFDPFFTTKEPGKGTGLGLSMVQGFVHQSHGFIRVASQRRQGTTVSILWPPTPSPEPAPAHEETSGRPIASGSTETIFVVEDEESVRHIVVRVLRHCGYQVLEAASPAAALDLLAGHQGPLDLLISDMVMPGMRGLELADQIQARRPGLRTLFITGYLSAEARRSVRNVLLKPFGIADLVAAVRRLLAERES